MYQREHKEWSNIWWEESFDTQKPRILLVGDSISVGYRPLVNNLFGGKIYADSYSTSKSLDNVYYADELNLVIQQCPATPSLVHFNFGLHGFHLSAQEYAMHYETMIHYFLNRHPQIKFTLALSTPITIDGDPATLHPKKNIIVEERNEQVQLLAKKFNLPLNDLYTPIVGKTEFRAVDGYHYLKPGYEYLAELVVGFIQKHL